MKALSEQPSRAAQIMEPDRGFFDGPGEMHCRCAAFDWASTQLGSPETWSNSLRSIVLTILSSHHPMFLWWGPELVQIFNDGYLPSFGTSGRDLKALGAKGKDHWAEIWPTIGPQIEGVMSRGTATWHEDQLVPIERNGRVENVWWTYGYSPVRDDDGTVGGVLVVVQETTARVLALQERDRLLEAERSARAEADAARELLTSVFTQAPVAIAVLEGRDLRFAIANPSYQTLIGGRDPVGKTLTDTFPDLANSRIEKILLDVYDSGTPFAASDFLLRLDSHGNGEQDNYYDLVYHPIQTGPGIRGIVAIAIDVTERHNASAERERLLEAAERAREDAEAANRTKGEFLAVMSHELRTPLNAIGGYAELLEIGVHGPITADQAKALSRIQQSQRHLLGLINGVLNYSRVHAKAVDFQIEEVRVDEVLAVCEALVAPQARSKDLSLRYEIDNPNLLARTDREKLQQIVLNLLSNAVKFTEPGGAITVRCGADPEELVAIRVIDTGSGISGEDLERVFQPFVQLDAKLTRTNEGTGLGLSISRDLARGIGGELVLETSSPGGSVFALLLPRAT